MDAEEVSANKSARPEAQERIAKAKLPHACSWTDRAHGSPDRHVGGLVSKVNPVDPKKKVLRLDDETRTRLQRARERAIGGRWKGRNRRIRQRYEGRVRVWTPDPTPPKGTAA